VGYTHLRYLRPFSNGLDKLIERFDKILVPELNNGQLVKIIREKYGVRAEGMNKIKGLPFTKTEILSRITKIFK
ncbi:MAG TPA: hypothetical protein VI583_08660, partial [Cyclobacteriaceae bacterium]|nr:hypothetical protein [Cyclobacteriaceae bacterium]